MICKIWVWWNGVEVDHQGDIFYWTYFNTSTFGLWSRDHGVFSCFYCAQNVWMALFFWSQVFLKKMASQILAPTLFVVCTSFSKVYNRLWTPPSSWWKDLHFFKNVFFPEYASVYVHILKNIYIQYLHVSCYIFTFMIHSYKSVSLYIHIFDSLSIELKSIEHSLHPIHRYHNCLDINASRAPQKWWEKKMCFVFFLWIWRWGLEFLEISYLPISGRRKISNIPFCPEVWRLFFKSHLLLCKLSRL